MTQFLQKYTINGFPFNCVSGVKYLGVSINCKMSWNDHIDDICTKARKSLFHSQEFTQLPSILAKSSLVCPTLEHACCVWDPHQRKAGNMEYKNSVKIRLGTQNIGTLNGKGLEICDAY